MDGNDAVGVYRPRWKRASMSRENGPMLLVLNTYRHMGHSKSDANVYRTKQEIEEWKTRCPIKRMRERLVAGGVFSAAQLDAIDAQAHADVEEAVRFADPARPRSRGSKNVCA